MERQFDNKNEKYFMSLLSHSDSIIRTRSVCILADLAGEEAVDPYQPGPRRRQRCIGQT